MLALLLLVPQATTPVALAILEPMGKGEISQPVDYSAVHEEAMASFIHVDEQEDIWFNARRSLMGDKVIGDCEEAANHFKAHLEAKGVPLGAMTFARRWHNKPEAHMVLILNTPGGKVVFDSLEDGPVTMEGYEWIDVYWKGEWTQSRGKPIVLE